MDRMVGTRYLAMYLALVGLGFLFVAGLGWYAGPSHRLSSRYEKGMAEILLSGRNIANPGRYDEGLLQKYYVSGLEESRDVVVLGSSRSVYLREHLFAGRSFFNSHVTAAVLGDYLAVYGLYSEEGLVPSVVVIEASPWLLGRNWERLTWTSLRDSCSSMAKRLGVEPSGMRTSRFASGVTEVLSWPYFKASLDNLIAKRGDMARVDYFPTHDPIGILCDGSLGGGHALGPRDVDIAEARAISGAEHPWGLDNADFDEVAVKAFEAFVEYLQAEGVEVVFYLAPFHPAGYDKLALSKAYGIIGDVEAYYRGMARVRGIAVVGSYDPEGSGCTREDFYDLSHPLESGVNKVFSSLDCTLPAR